MHSQLLPAAVHPRTSSQMGPRYRKAVRPYAQFITTLQISQMFIGLLVNGAIIYYTSLGARLSARIGAGWCAGRGG